MKYAAIALLAMTLTGCANLKVEWAVQASYSSANAQEAAKAEQK